MGLSEMLEGFNNSSLSAHEKGEHIIHLLSTMVGRLEEINDSLRAEDDQDTFIPYPFVTVTDAAGAATVVIERRPGYVLELVSLSAVGAAVGSGLLVYANDTTPQNLIYAGTNSGFFSDQFPEGSVIPDGAKLIVVWVGAGNTVNVSATLRGRKRMLDNGYRNPTVA